MAKVQFIAAICVAATSLLSPIASTTEALARGGGHHDGGGHSGDTGRDERSVGSVDDHVGTFSRDPDDHRNVTDRRLHRARHFQDQRSFTSRFDDHHDDCYNSGRAYDRAKHSLRIGTCGE
jgi:hypothetical protein